MKRVRQVLWFSALAALAAAARPAPAAATGAWTTFIRAYTYYDLLAEGDTVWCSTGEAGLLRYVARDQSFAAINREPNGLASNRLSKLLQDRSGRLWVGTLDAGASRLSADRKKWDLVNRFDGLPSDHVTAFAARGDTVLLGTTHGIALWNGREIAGALPDGFNPSPFTNGSDWITGIVIHGDSVWVSTQLGVYQSRFSQGLTTWTVETQLSAFNIQGIVANDTTIIALWGNLPLFHAFDASGGWAVASTKTDGNPIPNGARIYEDEGQILLTTEQGFYTWAPGNRWSEVTTQFSSSRDDDTRSFALTVDPSGRYFAADRDGLRERVGDPDTWALHEPPGPPGNNVLNVATEGGRLYVNTLGEGIGRFDGTEWRIWPFLNSPCTGPGCDTTFYSPDYAFALLVDREGKKWFSCWGEVIDVLDDDPGATPAYVHHLYTNDLHTRAMGSAADSLGGRWFGMDTDEFGNPERAPLGLEYYDPSGNYRANFRPDSSNVRGGKIPAVTVDRVGRLWVGYSGQGIDIFTLDPARPDTLPAPQTVLGSERYDVQGLVAHGDTVWALTTSELIAYKRTNAARIVSYAIPAAPAGLSVNPLAVARDGTVWVGTANGIRVVEPQGGVQDFNTKNSPLASDDVQSVWVDWPTGVAWIASSLGLNRYDPGYRPPPPPPVPELKVTVYPNPAWLSSVGISVKIDGNATSYSGGVYDLHGRRVRRFLGVGNEGVVWDGKTEQGDLARPGVYFIRVLASGKSGTSRVVLLR